MFDVNNFKILHVENINNYIVNLESLVIFKLQKDPSKIMLNQQNQFQVSKLSIRNFIMYYY